MFYELLLTFNVPAVALSFGHLGLRFTATICRQGTADRDLFFELPLLVPACVSSIALVWLKHSALARLGCCLAWHTSISQRGNWARLSNAINLCSLKHVTGFGDAILGGGWKHLETFTATFGCEKATNRN